MNIDKISVVMGFTLGVIFAGIMIGVFSVWMISSIPTGIIEMQNVNISIAFNETELVNAMYDAGAFSAQ